MAVVASPELAPIAVAKTPVVQQRNIFRLALVASASNHSIYLKPEIL